MEHGSGENGVMDGSGAAGRGAIGVMDGSGADGKSGSGPAPTGELTGAEMRPEGVAERARFRLAIQWQPVKIFWKLPGRMGKQRFRMGLHGAGATRLLC